MLQPDFAAMWPSGSQRGQRKTPVDFLSNYPPLQPNQTGHKEQTRGKPLGHIAAKAGRNISLFEDSKMSIILVLKAKCSRNLGPRAADLDDDGTGMAAQ
jgi:hypothetical protein